jgi:hypothetical protein
VSLQLVDVPEQTAIATLLRDVDGYILGRRSESATGIREIDRIVILPVAPAARVTSVAAPAPPPRVLGIPDTSDDSDMTGRHVANAPAPVQDRSETGAIAASGVGQPLRLSQGSRATQSTAASNEPPPRPADMPIRYLDGLDANGNRVREPSVPMIVGPDGSMTPIPVQPDPVPTNPFGVTTGSARPGPSSPATKR